MARCEGRGKPSPYDTRAWQADLSSRGGTCPCGRPRKGSLRRGWTECLCRRRWHLSVSPTLLHSYPPGQVRRKEKRPHTAPHHSRPYETGHPGAISC